MSQGDLPSHFRGKEALGHVVEAQSKGLIASSESHGTEMPGYWSAASDAARETAVAVLLVSLLLGSGALGGIVCFAIGWVIWKAGRSCWLGWQRLERLHRLMGEEAWEIQHHRAQERSELKELYRAKGFQGKLLDDVIDVLMADDERLLKVMLSEEMGLQLEQLDHPVQQSIGAALGATAAAVVCVVGFWLWALPGITCCALAILTVGAAAAANYERNRAIPAAVWNVAIGALAFGVTYFLLQFVNMNQ